MRQVLEGSHAISEAVRLARVQVTAGYPITPQTHIIEAISEHFADGTMTGRFIPVESEHSSMAAVVTPPFLKADGILPRTSRLVSRGHSSVSKVSGSPSTSLPVRVIGSATSSSVTTDWSSATLTDTDVAGNAVKLYTDLDFVGVETVASQIDASGMTHFSVDIWTPDATTVRVKLVDFGPDGAFGGGDDTEHEITLTSGGASANGVNPGPGSVPPLTAKAWNTLDIPLSDFTGLLSRGHLAQMIISGELSTIYVDNIYFYNDGSGNGGGGSGGSEPTEAAPTPTQNSSDVISLFSDAYTDVTVDTWRTDWSSATLEDVSVSGNAAKKYSDLDFVGILTEASTVDASGMTHLHLDVWSSDFTSFGIKLVDFGANGVYDGGGDDVEHQVDYATLNQGEWVSLDIPLSDFTALTTRSNLAQYILVGQPTGTTTVYIDNLYFYN